MDEKRLRTLLNNVKNNKASVNDAMQALKDLPYEDLDFVKIDNHRAIRKGFPEVIFCQGKTVEQVRIIAAKLSTKNDIVLGMRATEEMFLAVKKELKDKVIFNEYAKSIIIGKIPKPKNRAAIITADILLNCSLPLFVRNPREIVSS